MNKVFASLVLAAATTIYGCASTVPPEDEDSSEGADTVAKKQLPLLEDMWASYPRGDKEDVKKLVLGTNVDWSFITDTCVLRVSRTLNRPGTGIKFPTSSNTLYTVRGLDGENYALRVREIRVWLTKNFGKPAVSVSGSNGVDPAQFQGKKGVIVYSFGVGGHADLWNGTENAYHDDWSEAKLVELWIAPSNLPSGQPPQAIPEPSSEASTPPSEPEGPPM